MPRVADFVAKALWPLASTALAFAGCKAGGGHPSPPPGVTVETMTVTSASFPSGGAIPVEHTCDGLDRSPALAVSAPPPATQSLVLLMEDDDAPGTFTHWIAFNLRPPVLSVPEGADIATLGGAVGTNDFGRLGYGGPCPPQGRVHGYHFRVLALDAPLTLEPGARRSELDSAMHGHVLAEGALVGVFSH
jgi:Raf kinase inhibitor-like YbhB/YbcL family protein